MVLHVVLMPRCDAHTHCDGPAASISAGHQAALCRRHRHMELLPIQQQWPRHPHGHRYVANHVLTASSHDLEGARQTVNYAVKTEVKLSAINRVSMPHEQLLCVHYTYDLEMSTF